MSIFERGSDPCVDHDQGRWKTARITFRRRPPEVAAVAAIYFTLAGIVLYLVADWLLERIEVHRGGRLEHRTLVFFGILLALALATFPLLQSLLE